jgi:hypothetical protein
MLKFVECCGDIVGYGEVDGSIGVVPVESETAVDYPRITCDATFCRLDPSRDASVLVASSIPVHPSQGLGSQTEAHFTLGCHCYSTII